MTVSLEEASHAIGRDDQTILWVWAATRGKLDSIEGHKFLLIELENQGCGPGYRHNRIDGYDMPGSFEPPILVRNGIFDTKQIAGQFLEHSKAIERETVDLVFRSILEYDQRARASTAGARLQPSSARISRVIASRSLQQALRGQGSEALRSGVA